MQAALSQLDLSHNAAELYLKMLDCSALPASKIADFSNESRTYTYALLEELQEVGLVEVDESDPVKQFQASNPRKLDKLLEQKQAELSQQRATVQAGLDDLVRKYNLANNKPGVASGIGLEYFDATLKVMEQSTTPVLIFGSDDAPRNKEAFNLLLKRVYRRKRKGVESRHLFHKGDHQERLSNEFSKRGYEYRFIGDTPFEGEVVVYEDTVVLTTYVPELVTTTITDKGMANTLRVVFNLLWCQAEE